VAHQESERIKGEINAIRDEIEDHWTAYFKAF
jgi:hypothetical protein